MTPTPDPLTPTPWHVHNEDESDCHVGHGLYIHDANDDLVAFVSSGSTADADLIVRAVNATLAIERAAPAGDPTGCRECPRDFPHTHCAYLYADGVGCRCTEDDHPASSGHSFRADRAAPAPDAERRPLVCCLCLFVGDSDDPRPITVINGALVCEPHNGYFQGGDHVQAIIAWKREHASRRP